MKPITAFIKTCFVGGLFILLPLLLFYLLFAELLGIVVALATPIADLFPEDTFETLGNPVLVALVLLLGASFILGLALRSNMMRRFGSFLEQRTLMHLPLYNAVRRLSRGLVSARHDEVFKSGLLNADDGSIELVYIIEEHSDGRLTVMVPLAPLGFTGSIRVVDPARVTRLDASIGDASRVIAHWGVGMSAMMPSDKS